MANFISPYELHELYQEVLTDRMPPLPREMQSNFSNVATFGTKTIDMDQIAPDLRIGIYVGPRIQAKTTTGRGYVTKIFNPGYWKDKATVDYDNIQVRQIGQAFTTPTTSAGKIEAAIQQLQLLMESKRIRLQEYNAAQLLLFGNYTMQSELHPAINVDMEPNIATHLTTDGTATATVPAGQAVSIVSGRANRANISGTDVTSPTTGQVIPTLLTDRNWDHATDATPLADMQEMLDSSIEPIRLIYMSNDAWKELADEAVASDSTLLATDRTTLSSFNIDLLPKQETTEGLKLRGVIGAQNIPIITYTAEYQAIADDADTLTRYIGSGWVIMVPASQYGVQAYATIQHSAANFLPQEQPFWNSWTEDEMGHPWLQGQNAPILLHTKIKSTVAWKVM